MSEEKFTHNPIFNNIYKRRNVEIEIVKDDFSRFIIRQGDQEIEVDGAFFMDAKQVFVKAAMENPGENSVRIWNTLGTSNQLPICSWD